MTRTSALEVGEVGSSGTDPDVSGTEYEGEPVTGGKTKTSGSRETRTRKGTGTGRVVKPIRVHRRVGTVQLGRSRDRGEGRSQVDVVLLDGKGTRRRQRRGTSYRRTLVRRRGQRRFQDGPCIV